MDNDNKIVEYSGFSELYDDSAIYMMMPIDIISKPVGDACSLSNNISARAAVFSYFYMKRCVDNTVCFSIDKIAQWLGRNPNKSVRGINKKVLYTIECIRDLGYIGYSDEFLSRRNKWSLNVDGDWKNKNIDKSRYGILYLDEIKTILQYKDDSLYSNSFNNLLVFSYLRMMIPKRPNILPLSAISVEENKKSLPEAYDCFYTDISEYIGLSPRIVSRCVSELVDMGLIYAESLPRVRCVDNNGEFVFRTDHMLFCNVYKREKDKLYAYGEDYYKDEIERKKKKINTILKRNGGVLCARNGT